MKSSRSSMLVKVFVLVVGCSVRRQDPRMRSRRNGKFTLDPRNPLGGAVLPAGDYTFSLQSPSLPAPIVVRQTSGQQWQWCCRRQSLTEGPSKRAANWCLAAAKAGSHLSARCTGRSGFELALCTRPRRRVPAAETARLDPIADSQARQVETNAEAGSSVNPIYFRNSLVSGRTRLQLNWCGSCAAIHR